MAIAALNVLMGMLLAFGGLQEAVLRGIIGRETLPRLVRRTGAAEAAR
jgi:hypothetical protein